MKLYYLKKKIKLRTLYWKILDFIYDKIRRHVFFWKNYDSNADFHCVFCCKPVLGWYLYCSIKCTKLDEEAQLYPDKEDPEGL